MNRTLTKIAVATWEWGIAVTGLAMMVMGRLWTLGLGIGKQLNIVSGG